VNLFGHESASESSVSLRHELVIGPLRDHFLFKEKARQYYCIRCKWTFLAGRNKVAVLDQHGSPLARDETTKRFGTFAIGPCPVLEALALEAFDNTTKSQVDESGGNSNESSYRAPHHVLVRSGGFGHLLQVFNRLREDLRI
jgi:hypothetical protein